MSMRTHYPHPYDPTNKGVIIREWVERRFTKCPIVGSTAEEKEYEGTFLEYTFINKKKKLVHVPEYCLRVKWL